jgi:hypothetical protein
MLKYSSLVLSTKFYIGFIYSPVVSLWDNFKHRNTVYSCPYVRASIGFLAFIQRPVLLYNIVIGN